MYFVYSTTVKPPTRAQKYPALVFLYIAPLFLFSIAASAKSPGQSRLGLHGGDHVGVLVNDAEPFVSAGGHVGYGIVESVGPVSGNHHGLHGNLVGALYLKPQFSAALGLSGLLQFHPEDRIANLKDDRSLLGMPTATVRSGFPLSQRVLIGGELKVWLPGEKAPSVVWSATTINIAALASVHPTPQQILSFKAGFRLDNSENAAPNLARVSHGDRVSFPFSSYHAALAGILWMYNLNNGSIWSEFSARLLVGADVSAATSPMRISVGGRRAIHRNIELNAVAAFSLSQRPDIEVDDPLVPIEPRFLLLAGATYLFGLRDKPTKTTINAADNADELVSKDKKTASKTDTPEKADEGGSLSATIVDTDGLPVAGAQVTIKSTDFEKSTVTDRSGQFSVSSIPVGNATITVEMPFFDPLIQTIDVKAGVAWTPQLPPLKESDVGSQIRGLVRTFEGTPIEQVAVTVTPGDAVIVTNEDGEFQLDVDPGDYVVRIKAKGYQSQRRNVKVGTNSVEILNVELRKK